MTIFIKIDQCLAFRKDSVWISKIEKLTQKNNDIFYFEVGDLKQKSHFSFKSYTQAKKEWNRIFKIINEEPDDEEIEYLINQIEEHDILNRYIKN